MGAAKGGAGNRNRDDRSADARDRSADARDRSEDARDQAADARDETAEERDRAAERRDQSAKAERRAKAGRDRSQEDTARLRALEQAAADDRRTAAEDRRSAALDREFAQSRRDQEAVERAQQQPGDEGPRVPAPQRGEDAEVEPAPKRPMASTPGGDLSPAHEHSLALVRQAVALSAAIAGTEERIARTLQEMSQHGADEQVRRRLVLAREATQGVITATRYGERLQRLAEQSAEHAEMATLQSLVHRAGTVLVELARTEQSIAAALDRLAHFDEQTAEQRLQESKEASHAAQRALQRAEQLHQIGTRPRARDGEGENPAGGPA